MPTQDYRDAYTYPGNSRAGDSDAIDLDREPWNDLENGWDKLERHWNDPRVQQRPLLRDMVRHWQAAWNWKVGQIRARQREFIRAAELANCCICPAWLIAVWWDERSRMALDEYFQDDWLDALGIDSSTGPFQMKGAAAERVVKSTPGYTPAFAAMDADQLRDEMQDDFQNAAYLAADWMCIILAGYKAAGWDPCRAGALSEIGLIGTLWSQGTGSPKPNPRPNGRGRQIAQWAQVARTMFGLPNCDCCR